MEKNETGLKGVKEAIIEIKGDGVFKFLKNESVFIEFKEFQKQSLGEEFILLLLQ